MPPVYSTRFLAYHDFSISAPATYTVPTGFVLVLRDIDLYNGDVLGNTAFVQFSSTPAVVFFQASWGVNELGWRPWRGRQIFYAGESFTAVANRACDILASGYLLSS